MAVLPEYDIAARPYLGDRLSFTNIPVDLASLPKVPTLSAGDLSDRIRLFIGMRQGMEIQKGTARMLRICLELEKEMPGRCSVTCVRNLPLAEYLRRMTGEALPVGEEPVGDGGDGVVLFRDAAPFGCHGGETCGIEDETAESLFPFEV